MNRAHSLAAGLAVAVVAVVALLGGEYVPQSPTPTRRMSLDESQAIKREMVARVPGLRMGDVELDHCRPICLGGSNERDNLQLQPWPEARVKDEDERFYCAKVGRGEMPREIAAGLLAKRWPCGSGR